MGRNLFSAIACVPLLLGLLIGTASAVERVEEETAPGKITVVERTGATVPLEAVFRDENGDPVTLGSLLARPTILLPIYFTCPNSCSTNLANLAVALDRMKLRPGIDYRAIALSFDERETPAVARSAKANYLRLLGDDFPADQWLFLTGDRSSIEAVLDAVGFSFKALPDGTFIHPSMLVVLAESGMIIKYVYGTFIPGDVELAVAEAARGRPATSIKRFLDYCFNYLPTRSAAVFTNVKLIVLLLFGAGLAVFFVLFLKNRKSGEPRDHAP